jgi:hypothetical protein
MTKKTFDLALLVVLLAKPATGILRLAARRWSDETSGSLKTIGDAVQVAL